MDHIANPRDDLTTYLLNVEFDGHKLDPSHTAGSLMVLLIAGIDTSWSAIGTSLWHLATTPMLIQHLEENPDDTHALSEIIHIYCDKLHDHDAAERFLEEALEPIANEDLRGAVRAGVQAALRSLL